MQQLAPNAQGRGEGDREGVPCNTRGTRGLSSRNGATPWPKAGPGRPLRCSTEPPTPYIASPGGTASFRPRAVAGRGRALCGLRRPPLGFSGVWAGLGQRALWGRGGSEEPWLRWDARRPRLGGWNPGGGAGRRAFCEGAQGGGEGQRVG